MRDFLCISLFVLALAVLEAAVGPQAAALRSVLGMALALVAVIPLLPGVRGTLPLVGAAAAFVLAGALPPARGFLLAAGFAGVALAQRGERPITAATLAVTALGYAVFAAVRDWLTLWPVLLALSSGTSALAAGLVGVPARLGPTAFGAWIVIAVAIVFLARVAVVRRVQRGRGLGALLLLGLAPVVWLAFGRLSLVSGLHALQFRIVLFVLCLPALAVFLRAHATGAAAVRPPGRRLVAAAAALLVVGLVLLSWSTRIPARAVRLVVDTRGSFSMEPLQWGVYGSQATQGASLATLPALVAAHGFACTLHDTTIDAALLERHDVLVVMNPTRNYSPAEHAAIWEFVRRGGGLLVLGDHTNIQETMEPVNTLLAPCGVRIEFDSAIPLVERWSWFNCMRIHPHPVTRGLEDESQIKLSVGASLHLPPAALPLLSGREAFSDPGNWLNVTGAYLGNMRPDPGEPRGDLPLAAACTVGRGRVIVFGDTSPFQRTAVTHSHRLVLRVLTYLAGRRAGTAPFGVRAAGSVLLVAGAVLLAHPAALPALAVAAAVSGAWLAGVDRVAIVEPPPGPRRGEVAWIDLAHGNRVDRHAGRDDGIGGFVDHLWRQKYVPLAMHHMDLDELTQGRVFATVAPAFAFTSEERRALRRFVESGGLLVVATGYEERRGAESLLADFGYAIGRTPIGAAHQSVTHLEGERALMHESWPVERPEGHGEVWVESWGFPLVVHERIGAGSLLVIGDSRFLCDVKLESPENFVETNIDFLRKAFEVAQPQRARGAE